MLTVVFIVKGSILKIDELKLHNFHTKYFIFKKDEFSILFKSQNMFQA